MDTGFQFFSKKADSKSVDSSKSTDKEDDVEVARNAATKQEIKRILTEVLLKVQIVLSEDNLTAEDDHSIAALNLKVSPSTPAILTPKASANALVPAKPKEADYDDNSGKSSSSSPGHVLGLANYASDDEGDDEIHSSNLPNSEENPVLQQPITTKLSEDTDAVNNGPSGSESEDHYHMDSEPGRMDSYRATASHSAQGSKLSDNRADREPAHGDVRPILSTKFDAGVVKAEINNDCKKELDGLNTCAPENGIGEIVDMKTDLPGQSCNTKKVITDDSQGIGTRNKLDKNLRRESKRSSAGKEQTDEKSDENGRMQDEIHLKNEITDDQNGLKRENERGRC
ncbi:unnamed protein product [Ilex paraguariensis]|uniref:Uncharacterized protein n=1 Tax=Ilex paraguariensis TaxID=185542 RepID=A0ABC8TW99_9AQUA